MPRVPTIGLSPTSRPQFQAPGVVAYGGRPMEMQESMQRGARMERIGQVVSQIGLEIEDKVNDARAMEATNAFENGVNKAFLEYRQLKGKDGVDGLAAFQQQVQELRDNAGGMLMNDMQRAAAMPIFDKIGARTDLRAQEHYMGAAAEYKQQQVVAERIKLEDALRSEPLGANSVALFMRLRQNLAKEAEGLGYSDERLDAHVLENTSKLVNDLFNHYADSDRPEDALAFLQAVEVFEQSPMSAAQGPASMRGKTYEEAKAAAEAEKQPVGAVMFESTRASLKKKAKNLSLNTWAMRTVDGYQSASDAFEDAEVKFTSGEWTAAEREAVEKRAATVFDRQRTLSGIAASETLEAAKSEYMRDGKISQATRDSLDGARKLDDFVGWVGRVSDGKASDQGDSLKWGAYQAAYDNDTGIAGIASRIRTREDLMLVFKDALSAGATQAEAKAWARKIGQRSKYGEQKDVEEELQGLSTATDVEQYATDWFGGQWAGVIEKAKMGDSDTVKEAATATLGLKSDRTREFKQAFDKKVRELRSLDTGLEGEALLERARSEAWQDGIRTYEVGGETRKINTWLARPSEIEAATIAATPAGTLSTLEGYMTTYRVVGEPDDPKRQQTIHEAATREFVRENMPATMLAENRQRELDLARNTSAAMRMMGLPQPMAATMAVAGAMQAYPPLPQRAALDIDSPAGQFRLLQIAQEIQLRDTESLTKAERQDQLKRELWSSINRDIEHDGWVLDARRAYRGGRPGLPDPGRVSFLEDRYRNEFGPLRNEFKERGLTDESFEEVLRLHPTFASARSGDPLFTLTRNKYWTPQPYPEEGQEPQAVEAGR